MDSYEEFMNDYCDFMETYDKSDASALREYTSMMTKYAEFAEKVEKYDEEQTEEYYHNCILDLISLILTLWMLLAPACASAAQSCGNCHP